LTFVVPPQFERRPWPAASPRWLHRSSFSGTDEQRCCLVDTLPR